MPAFPCLASSCAVPAAAQGPSGCCGPSALLNTGVPLQQRGAMGLPEPWEVDGMGLPGVGWDGMGLPGVGWDGTGLPSVAVLLAWSTQQPKQQE